MSTHTLIEDMRRASRLIDESTDTVDYQMRCVALALLARQFLRELDAAAAIKEIRRR
jgi:hypothetical protein